MLERSLYGRIAAVVLALGLVAVAIVFDPEVHNAFRLTKEFVFRGVAILLLPAAVFAATRRDGSWRELGAGIPRRELLICGAVLLWTLITTLTSANRVLSVQSAITVVASIIIFLAARRLAPGLGFIALDVCFATAVINALFVTVQEIGIWQPFHFDILEKGTHMSSTGLLGNPNDVGTFLAAPLLAAVTSAAVLRGRRRWIYAAVSAVILIGVVASATRTALVAVAVAGIALAVRYSWRYVAIAVVVLLAAVLLLVPLAPGLANNIAMAIEGARTHQYDVLLSNRIVPSVAAADMLLHHPVFGVGPGCFKFLFMDERIALVNRLPASLTGGNVETFAQVHNDHLQVAAETGLPGYALLLAAIVLLGMRRRTAAAGAADPRVRIGIEFRLALAWLFTVIAIAQFPLQIASTRMMYLVLAAIALGWSDEQG